MAEEQRAQLCQRNELFLEEMGGCSLTLPGAGPQWPKQSPKHTRGCEGALNNHPPSAHQEQPFSGIARKAGVGVPAEVG